MQGLRNFFAHLPSGFASYRDLFLFLIGLGLLVSQVLSAHGDPLLITTAASMMGLPLVLSAIKDDNGKKNKEP